MNKLTKTALIVMLFAICGLSNIANAQNIQAYSDATIDGRGFSYNVQLSITPLENNEVTQSGGWIVKIISVNADSKGYYHKGKTDRYFSCSELGNICNPSKFNAIYVKVKYQCDNNAEKLITFYGLDREQTIVVKQKPNTKCNIELVSVQVRNNDGDVYHKRISEIEYPQQNTSTTNSNVPTSSSSNPIANETKQTDTGMPVNNSGNDPLKHFETDGKTYTNPMSNNTNSGSSAVDNFNKGYQQGQQIADVATGIADLFAPTPAQLQRRAAETAEYERLKKIKDNIVEKEKEERFGRLYYYPLIDKAKKGDDNAQMTLYYASYHLWCTEFVPLREEWLNRAYKNNNLDAILEVSRKSKGRISMLENAAKLGSADAMVMLGEWFDTRNNTVGSAFVGGGNPKTALYWYEKAAEKNDPKALYYLGMIYKYGITQDLSNGNGFLKSLHVKYDVIIDEKIAFDYFLKALKNENNVSLYSRGDFSPSTGFDNNTFKELALMYKKGKVIEKDKEKAKELENNYKNYKFVTF